MLRGAEHMLSVHEALQYVSVSIQHTVLVCTGICVSLLAVFLYVAMCQYALV